LCLDLELIAINVPPAPVFAHKAAALVLAHGAPGQTKARHKFDLSVIGASDTVLFDFQSQPLAASFEL